MGLQYINVFAVAMCLSSTLLFNQGALAHSYGSHYEQIHTRKMLQNIEPQISAAAADLAATAVPISESQVTSDQMSDMIISAAVEQSPAGGWRRCSTNAGSRAQVATSERRFQRLVAQLISNGTISPPNNTTNGTITMESAGVVTPAQVTTTTIPTYFHAITFNGQGTVTGNQISAQLTVLNNAFRSSGFQFSSAGAWQYTTTSSALYNAASGSSAELSIKSQTRKGTRSSLNIWLWSIPNNVLGFAYLPWSNDATRDGVVIRTGTITGGSTTGYNEGDTAVHEVGHYLGLLHTFEGGCATSGDRGGDFVADTPAVRTQNGQCIRAVDSCPSLPGSDMLNNYMDYPPDACLNAFTPGQARRMQQAWAAYRQGK